MIDSLQQAIERVRAADNAAHASQLAFTLGPEQFIAHVTDQAEQARKRIEEEYAAEKSAGVARPPG